MGTTTYVVRRPDIPPRGDRVVTFWTDDVFATAEQMKKKGVELAAEPRKEVWGTMAKFKDPDGNEFVFSSR